MARDQNSVNFTGRLGTDPEMRYLSDNVAVTNFRFAVGLAKDKTMWFDVTTWRNLAETVNKYLHKGSRVAVTGRLDLDEWEGDDGVRRSKIKIIANNVTFLDSKSDSGSNSGGGSTTAQIGDLLDNDFDSSDEDSGGFPL